MNAARLGCIHGRVNEHTGVDPLHFSVIRLPQRGSRNDNDNDDNDDNDNDNDDDNKTYYR